MAEYFKDEGKTIAFMKDVLCYMSSSDSTGTFPYYLVCQDVKPVESLDQVSEPIFASSLSSYAMKKKTIVNLKKVN